MIEGMIQRKYLNAAHLRVWSNVLRLLPMICFDIFSFISTIFIQHIKCSLHTLSNNIFLFYSYVGWDDFKFPLDPDNVDRNTKSGTLPSGQYGYPSMTLIQYACREDGPASTPIVLPSIEPFFLLRYGSACQQVCCLLFIYYFFLFRIYIFDLITIRYC